MTVIHKTLKKHIDIKKILAIKIGQSNHANIGHCITGWSVLNTKIKRSEYRYGNNLVSDLLIH